jgi:hypothetical protein
MYAPDFLFEPMRPLTEANATVNSDAYCKCLVSRYPRGYCRPSEHRPHERVDQALSSSDYKFHLISVQHWEHHHWFAAHPA